MITCMFTITCMYLCMHVRIIFLACSYMYECMFICINPCMYVGIVFDCMLCICKYICLNSLTYHASVSLKSNAFAKLILVVPAKSH